MVELKEWVSFFSTLLLIAGSLKLGGSPTKKRSLFRIIHEIMTKLIRLVRAKLSKSWKKKNPFLSVDPTFRSRNNNLQKRHGIVE